MIRVAVVGYGRWGPNLARCVMGSGACELAGVVDQSRAALDRVAIAHPDATLWTDWRVMLEDPTVDAVIVATPTRSHFEIAGAALRAGKHVLVEKPLTETSEQAEALIEEARQRGLVLMVDHTFIYTGAIRKIRDLVQTGDLGALYYYDSVRINLGAFQPDVDVVWDLAAHDLAVLDFLFDEKPTSVSATGAAHLSGRPVSSASVTLFYPSGATARLGVSWMSPIKVRRTLIGGSRAMIHYDEMEPDEKLKLFDTGVDIDVATGALTYRVGEPVAQLVSGAEALATEIEHFADCVANGREPLSSGETGLWVVGVLEAATRSMHAQGQPVQLPAIARTRP
jgi:predicted dehydrogenase